MPTAHDLLATYRLDCATLPPEIADAIRDADRACAIADNEVNEAVTRRTLAEERLTAARERADAYIVERSATLLLSLHVKLDADGIPVPRQGAPRGPRQKPADPSPTTQATEAPGTAADAFFAAVSDRAPAAELAALGWDDAAVLSDAQTRVVCKHQIVPDEVAGFVVGGVVVAHKTWTMADDARVVE